MAAAPAPTKSSMPPPPPIQRPATVTIAAFIMIIGGFVQLIWAFIYPWYFFALLPTFWEAALWSLICSGFQLFLGLFLIGIGAGMLRFIPQTWILALIVGIFALFNFPVGTTMGIILIIVLVLPSTRAAFDEAKKYYAAKLQAQPPA